MLCLVAAVKCLRVHHHKTDCIFWFFGITKVNLESIRKQDSVKASDRGVDCIAHFITGHDRTQ